MKLVWAIMVVLAVAADTYAQTEGADTTVASITSATDTAAVNEAANASGVSSASEPLISTAVDTTVTAAGSAAAPEVDRSPVYRSAIYYLLLFVLLCVFIGVIGKILTVYELSRDIQGKKTKFDWRKLQGVLFGIALIAGLYGTYWSYRYHGAMSMSESASVHGEEIDFMFYITVVITTIVFIITHILLFGFSYSYRGSEKKKAYFYPHNNSLERIWTVVPAIVLTVLVLLGFFTWRTITNVSESDQRKAINIEVTGEQFKWNVRYAGIDNQVGNRNYKLITATNALGIDFNDRKSWDDRLGSEIKLPVNKPVRVTIGSKDVLHSFYMPDFRVQMNAVPGMPTYFQFTPRLTTAEMKQKKNNPKFEYVLLCAKICGSAHWNMQYKVSVVSEEEYEAWLTEQSLFYNDDMKKEMQMAEEKKAAESKKMALNKNSR